MVKIIRDSKVESMDTIIKISSIITGVSFIIYLPILVIYIFGPKRFTRIKFLNLQLVIASIIQGATFFYQGYNTQEYLCIVKGPFNLIPYFCIISTSTLIVYVAYKLIWNPSGEKVNAKFLFWSLIISWGIPILFTLSTIVLSLLFKSDYNHPCWIANIISVSCFYIWCFLYFGIGISYLVISIIKLNRYLKQYGNDELCLKFKKRLYRYLVLMIFTFLDFLHKLMGFIAEYHHNFIRDFLPILFKYIIETINGPLYVLIYCYNEEIWNSIKEFILCRKKNNENQSSKEEMLTKVEQIHLPDEPSVSLSTF